MCKSLPAILCPGRQADYGNCLLSNHSQVRILFGVPFIWRLSMRTRAERRYLNKKKALRKRWITRNAYSSYSIDMQEYYDNLHQYSKNKIHCSCPMCSSKTNNRGRLKWYGIGRRNWKHSDLIKINRLESQLTIEN